MSDFSLTLVLQIKTSKIIFNDVAKVQQKSEKISAFGGIFFLNKFDSILSSVIDSHLGLRSTLIGYQYSEIIRAISAYPCPKCGHSASWHRGTGNGEHIIRVIRGRFGIRGRFY